MNLTPGLNVTDVNFSQVVTILKSVVANVCHTRRDGDGGKVHTIEESTFTNARHAVLLIIVDDYSGNGDCSAISSVIIRPSSICYCYCQVLSRGNVVIDITHFKIAALVARLLSSRAKVRRMCFILFILVVCFEFVFVLVAKVVKVFEISVFVVRKKRLCSVLDRGQIN